MDSLLIKSYNCVVTKQSRREVTRNLVIYLLILSDIALLPHCLVIETMAVAAHSYYQCIQWQPVQWSYARQSQDSPTRDQGKTRV